ncbi:MAG: hypothetical protein GX643_08045 [Acidimicrobiales bacterium]|nr:hypothetical protein [Acidimicrobiales bacterium]
MATITGTAGADDLSFAGVRAAFGPWVVAGAASIGAGAIHAAAIGVHAEHQQAARTFAVLALLQIAWGAVALVAKSRVLAVAGAALGVGAVGGWVLAKTGGIGFIDGLEASEEIQLPDALAAGLALVVVLAVARGLVVSLSGRTLASPPRAVLHGVGVVVLVASLVGMAEAGTHSHAGGHHGDDVAAGGHDHGDGTAAAADDDEGEHEHAAPAVPPKKYNPDEPIDLSGVPGVSLAQQARAENLIAITLDRLPQFADPAYAESQGFRSIGDGFTGHEHYINWSYITDEHILNPDYPESLVYDTSGPEKELVSAMFMTEPGVSLDDVPELGGALTQWHVHEDLCFTNDPEGPRVAGLTGIDEDCRPPLEKFPATPMIHVWITPHVCGPFAALEGVAAGQVKEGEEHLCNTLHGH